MFEVRIVPLLIISYLLCSGFYDVLVQNISRCIAPRGSLPKEEAE